MSAQELPQFIVAMNFLVQMANFASEVVFRRFNENFLQALVALSKLEQVHALVVWSEEKKSIDLPSGGFPAIFRDPEHQRWFSIIKAIIYLMKD